VMRQISLKTEQKRLRNGANEGPNKTANAI
jgi:hypothetical protein